MAVETSEAMGVPISQLVQLDPRAVTPSRWANRDVTSLSNRAFERLKTEIGQAGGNVQPIKVRPAGSGYEIVFGHRRHRACLELGLSVLAAVVEIDDRALWEEMERENRGRVELSPFEQGRHYRIALDAGLYPSIRRLAAAIGVDPSQAAKVIRIADLPADVISAFKTPSDIQVNWASAIHAALQRDPDVVVSRAHSASKNLGAAYPAKATFNALVGLRGVEPFHTEDLVVLDDRVGARVVIKQRKAGYHVEIIGTSIGLSALQTMLRQLLNLSGDGSDDREE